MGNFLEDFLAPVFEEGRKVLSGEKSLSQLGEEIFGEGQAPAIEQCEKSATCVLGKGHAADKCSPLREVK